MAYSTSDPYSNQGQEKGLTFGSIAGEVANPLNWLMYNPGMYRWSGDIKVPAFMRSANWNKIGKGLGNLTDMWIGKGGEGISVGRKLTYTLGKVWRGVRPEFGAGLSEAKLNRIHALKAEMMTKDYKRKVERHFQRKVNSKYLKRAEDFFLTPTTPGQEHRIPPATPNQRPRRYKARAMAHKYRLERLQKLNKAGKAITGVKIAARIGKVGSIIGLTTLLWELGTSIGEPIGRGVMNKMDSGLSKFEERFLPEVTRSRLNASYLSYGAATERQRAIESLSKASINGRSAFGQEAMYLHQ